MYADLHTHTNASDGEHSPEELIQLAVRRGVTVLAVTDHDTTASLDRAVEAATRAGVDLIPGVELSVDVLLHEIHILGYFIDWQSDDLQEMLSKFREERTGRAEKMVRKLNALGASLSFERVKEIAGDAAIGRPHVAQALVEIEFVQTPQEAFDKYIGHRRPAYVDRLKFSPEAAIQVIRRANGIPVLAHPAGVLDFVPRLKRAGLLGLEVWYAEYDSLLQQKLHSIAAQYDLIATGGSDFHGASQKVHGSALGQAAVPLTAVAQLKRMKRSLVERRLHTLARGPEWKL